MKPLYAALLPPVALALLLTSGCDGEREHDPLFSTPAAKQDDPDLKALHQDLSELSNVRVFEELKGTKGREEDADKAIACYHEAMQRLTRRGSAIESQLVETLLGSDDWGVRLGVVETMQSVGTKRSISPLIQVLTDSQPLVAMNANLTLQEMTRHQVIPEAGKPAVDGLPPLPVSDPKALDPDIYLKAWRLWHVDHKLQLQQAWSGWWEKNKATAKVE